MKKLLGILLAAVVLWAGASVFMGHHFSTAMTVDDEEISAGMYLMFQLMAYNEAVGKVDDAEKDVLKQTIPLDSESEAAESELPDASSTPAESIADSDVSASTSQAEDPNVERVDATKWIRSRTEEMCREYVAVRKLCAEHELMLSEESEVLLEQNMEYWPMISEYYVQNGIGEETIHDFLEYSLLRQDLYTHLYGEGGEKAPSRDEISKLYGERNAHLRTLSFDLLGPDFETELPVAEDIRAQMNTLLEQLRAGEITLEQIAQEQYPLIMAQIDDSFAAVEAETLAEEEGEAEEEAGEETADTEQNPEGEQAAEGEGESAEEEEQSPLSTQYYAYATGETSESESFKALLEELKGMKVGDFGINEDEGYIVLYEVIPTFETDEEYEAVRDTLVQELKNEEYNTLIEEAAAGYTVKKVFGAEWYLNPKKIKVS